VVAYDPYIDENHAEIAELGIRMGSLEAVLAASDVLSVHLPNTDSTRNLLDADKLAQLPRGAYVINVGRGEVVDEHALADAVETGHIAGAGLDVRHNEPPVRGRLEELPNVILTPHVAGVTVQAQQRIARILCDEIDAVLSGAASTYAVGAHRRHQPVGTT
jgi:phosphoglycerate dehydrogenase-like enzyme